VPLQDREQVYCTTTRLGLFYLHTFVACAEASNRYAVCLCADGGVYTAQIEAASLEEALPALQDPQQHGFREFLPQAFHALLRHFEAHRVLRQEYPPLAIAACDATGQATAPPTRKGQEWRFSPQSCVLFVVPIPMGA
jgi:hypothetical protein